MNMNSTLPNRQFALSHLTFTREKAQMNGGKIDTQYLGDNC